MSESVEEAQSVEEKAPWVMREPAEADEAKNNPLVLLLVFAAIASSWIFGSSLLFVLIVGVLISILLHEFGHFATARLTGMKATQFFLFMGPRIWSFRRGETEYGIRTYPVGAFVRIVGMSNLDPPEPGDEDRAYMHKSFPRRLLVITAGSLMHFTIAIGILTVLLSVVGVSVPVEGSGWRVASVGGPAVEAGLEPGDQITAVDDVVTGEFAVVREYLADNPGETVEIDFIRDGQIQTTQAELLTREDGSGQLCLSSEHAETERIRSGPLEGVTAFGRFVSGTFSSFDELPRGYWARVSNIADPEPIVPDPIQNDCAGLTDEASGPVSLIGFIDIANQSTGWQEAFLLLAGFNIVLGIFNLFPFLPLDGGHAALAIYERLRSWRGKRHYADMNKLVGLTYGAVVLLIVFSVPILLVDAVLLFK